MEPQTLLLALVGGAFSLAAFALLARTFFTVDQGTTAIVQRFGKFLREAEPGLRVKAPFVDVVAGRVDLRLRRFGVKVETKTADDVFVRVVIAVQYHVLPAGAHKAFYKLGDAAAQLASLASDAVRGRVPWIALRELFEQEGELAELVRGEIGRTAARFGYGIFKVLVTEIEPGARVKEAMGEADVTRRMCQAAAERAEIERVSKAKAAQTEAVVRALRGRAAVEQRRAAVTSLRESVGEFRRALPCASMKDVMNFVLMAQYYDTLKAIGAPPRSGAVLAPPTPAGVAGVTERLRNGLFEADRASILAGEAPSPGAAARAPLSWAQGPFFEAARGAPAAAAVEAAAP
jgi:regulator of protease activity HflC (stomatin/prohibitin superfamily)